MTCFEMGGTLVMLLSAVRRAQLSLSLVLNHTSVDEDVDVDHFVTSSHPIHTCGASLQVCFC